MIHLFFDLDRTLWDFEKNSKIALEEIYLKHKINDKVKNFYDFLNVYQNINRDLWVANGKGKITKDELRIARFAKTLDKLEMYDEALATNLDLDYLDRSPYQTHLFPNALETLAELKREKYQLHIITNGFTEVQHIKLKNSGLSPFFQEIICSEEVGVNKPNRAIFEYSLEKTGAKKEKSCMIGDDLVTDIQGANNFGMRSVHFDPERKIRKQSEQNRIYDLKELPELLPWIFRTN